MEGLVRDATSFFNGRNLGLIFNQAQFHYKVRKGLKADATENRSHTGMVGYRHFVLKTKFFDSKVLNDLCSCSQLIAGFHNLYKGETSRMGMDGVARICKEYHAFFCHQSSPV